MKEILKQVIHGKTHITVGKAGISESLIDQVRKQFKKKKILKIRFLVLNDHNSMKEACSELSKKGNAKVLDIRGKTCVIQDLKKQK